ncbi:MAG: OmpA family protein [Bacteroidetes bacterium]|nr:OmpA family protein [Bacteroidota bacterium]
MKFIWKLFFTFLIIHGGVFAQDAHEMLFSEVEQLYKQANLLNAVISAPESYANGLEEYGDAKQALKDGDDLEDIKEKITLSENYFKRAVEVAEMANETFADLFKARSDCKSIAADIEAKEDWVSAEELLSTCMKDFENGDIQDAKETANDAEKLYRKSELTAIKGKYLGEVRELIKKAGENDIQENAPVTFAKAQLLLQQAESELNDNRYDNEHAVRIIKQSKYESKHAMYIDKLIREMVEAEKSWEELILDSEKLLKTISDKYSLEVGFENGYEQAKEAVIAFVDGKEESIIDQKNTIAFQKEKIKSLETNIDSINTYLAGVLEEKSALQIKVDAFEKEKREFREVAELFSLSEAEVFRDGKNVVIRLISLVFDAGKSIIDPQYFAVLSKVQKAIEKFNQCTVSVEGHTDAQGSDDKNLDLSQERAEAVRQYLLANIDMNTTKLLAIGFGETKPVANNETEDGRRKNRRIDIVINPHN